jgi:hypothetical protein
MKSGSEALASDVVVPSYRDSVAGLASPDIMHAELNGSFKHTDEPEMFWGVSESASLFRAHSAGPHNRAAGLRHGVPAGLTLIFRHRVDALE